jgi:transposase InsO family protein
VASVEQSDGGVLCRGTQRGAGRFGKPKIFNSDQGSQFTSEEFTRVLLAHRIEISMDGRGRCHDNIFVERLWWTVKHQWVYLRPAADGLEQKHSLTEFFDWYSRHRPIRGSVGKHRMRPTSADLRRPWQRRRDKTALLQYHGLNLIPGVAKPSAGDSP